MCGHCPESYLIDPPEPQRTIAERYVLRGKQALQEAEAQTPHRPRLGLSREEYILKHGSEDARRAVSEIRAAERVVDEPPPRPGFTDVWPTAYRQFEQVFAHQVNKGYEKYGTVLQNFNGRDSYKDFLAEQADGLVYATQLYQEACTFVELTARAVRLLELAYEYIRGETLAAEEIDELITGSERFQEEATECLQKSGLSRSQSQSRDGSS